ncbi:hypothetical protein RHSIM_RhsimUnG0144300 [Rhododendron simsii]|uniref:Cation/H+ exchanger domain-containing protein n=1 Tax=Rhododendron simsii TaxID=118357 RepID=A0A834FV24_RHOSS|nr:hypothetical protein RHSIM_RhsimUnG0144300 [Rhododendron simsii]
MVCHMFVLGLEIDHKIFLNPPVRETKAACTGMLSTFILALILTPFLHVVPHTASSTKFNLSLSIVLSGTASPLLTRLITDLKIGKSDIGRFVVLTGVISDLVSTLLLSLGFIFFDPVIGYGLRDVKTILQMVSVLVIETVIAAQLSPLIMNWVNSQNPEGKPMKGSHLILSVAYVVSVCSSSTLFSYNSILSAFLAGLFMPREGRISKMMISKVNYFLTTIFYPVLFVWVGVEADLTKFDGDHLGPWARLFFLFVIATVGKVAGTVVSGVMLGFHWPEAVAIGLLLNIKGHFHVYLAITAAENKITTTSTSMSILFAIFLTVIYTPLVVANIIDRARKRSPTQRMALQWHDPSTELRILLCLRGPQNLRSAINFIEISRGTPDQGISVYVSDMVELTDKIAATLVHGRDGAVAVMDAGVVEMREEVTRAVEGYVAAAEEGGGGVEVKRMVAVATMNNMHQDVCILAEDLMVALIVMPFHKEEQAGDGRLGVGHSGFRHVNRKVLRHAPCSVGILVDRGLGSIANISRSTVSLNVAVIFIGGKDDREVLAYAGRVARHTGVKLTVIRFLLEANSENASTSARPGRPKVNTPEQEEEMRLDDECFTDFYDRHVARGRVAYMEKYLVNSGQTFATLRAMEGQYGLFIVGRGGRVNSVLTVGMNDWEECPELGPIGDILSASDFSVTASVLIVQQHSLRGELAGLDDEFSIM